jgi:simple sugar transport system permease protein
MTAMLKRAGLALAAPVLALLVAGVLTTLVLLTVGDSPAAFWDTMLAWPENRSLVNIINEASVLYLSGLARPSASA